MTGGMDNPVDVVFTPEGERIFSATLFVGDGRRDGIAHAIYGGVYGKEHGVLDGHPRTGELMPVFGAHEPDRAVRLGALRVDGVRRRVSRQLVRLPVQSAQGVAARAEAARQHVRQRGQRLRHVATTSIFIRPTC